MSLVRRHPRIITAAVVFLLVLVPGVAVASCVARVSDASPYAALLDRLPVPAGWQLEHTTVWSLGGSGSLPDAKRASDHLRCEGILPVFDACPRVIRYYRVEGPTPAVFDEGVQMLLRARIPISVGARECKMPNVSLSSGCIANGYPTGSSDKIQIVAWPDRALDLDLQKPGATFVRVTASPTLTQFELNSPQPTVRP